MATEMRKEFAKYRGKLLRQTERQQFICARCGRYGSGIHIHHIKELVDGGENGNSNLIPLCGTCHDEWDYAADTGMSFGEFLVSLPVTSWLLITKSGLWKSPYSVGKTLSNLYVCQFVGQAIKYNEDNPFAYWDELEHQNEMFPAYPYSDHEKMIKLYGDFYRTSESEEEFSQFADKAFDEIREKLKMEPARSITHTTGRPRKTKEAT